MAVGADRTHKLAASTVVPSGYGGARFVRCRTDRRRNISVCAITPSERLVRCEKRRTGASPSPFAYFTAAAIAPFHVVAVILCTAIPVCYVLPGVTDRHIAAPL